MDIPDYKWLPELADELQNYPYLQTAAKTYRQLEIKGCDFMVIRSYVDRAAGYKRGSVYLYGKHRGIARQIRGISVQLKKLAKRIEYLRKIWGFRDRLDDTNCLLAPEELKDLAHRLSKVKTRGLAGWNPQREAIRDLLDHVRTSTGRYHYAEVSLLINAERTWRAMKHDRPLPELSHDVDSLKMIVQRWNKERRAASAKLLAHSKSAPPHKPKKSLHPRRRS